MKGTGSSGRKWETFIPAILIAIFSSKRTLRSTFLLGLQKTLKLLAVLRMFRIWRIAYTTLIIMSFL
ncbi:hypothetical protein [Phocaeicola coprocola]|uniref:hypothetical protein n=1 Tax=Phocaeicola coprocola TaxID=310298 RepID=UPI00266C0A0B|nr:hypothetical protein [Phocaeicola coprocola]